MLRLALLALLVAALTSCGGSMTTTDAGGDGASGDAGGDLGSDAGADGSCHTDADSDGHVSMACGGDDCDDTDPNRYPGNLEVCDPAGEDEDCDPSTLGPDHDGDGTPSILCCDRQADATLLCGTDCDDTRATVNATAVETCNGVDDNCNGMIDEGVVATTFYPDCDGDLFGGTGTAGMTMMGCSPPTTPPTVCGGHGSWATNATDCDDTRASVNPSAPEICDGIDDNCDGNVDELVPGYFPDCDRDGYGGVGGAVVCALPSLPPDVCPTGGWSPTSDDCNDAVPTTHPHATETCNGVDDDCDGTIDGAPAATWCGGPHSSVSVCTSGTCSSTCLPGFVDCSGAPDCDDLMGNPLHCGTCTHACGAPTCIGGACTEDFVAIAAAGLSMCGVRASGRTTCWGYDSDGQFGLGLPHTLAPLPATDSGFAAATAMSGSAVGETLFCALHADHTVSCAGANNYGECGAGFPSGNVFAPATVVGLANATQISVGPHACALRSDRTVVCWGEGASGQCGDNVATDTTPRLAPVTVFGIADATQVVVARSSSCAVHADHTVSCWGSNNLGQLGTGDTTDSFAPRTVLGLSDAVRLGAGNGTMCAVRSSGAVACWGENADGQVGDGTTTMRLAPTAVVGITDAVDVTLSEHFACALHATGAVSCWGDNSVGCLGDGTRTSSHTPVDVVGLSDAVELRAGLAFVCARHASNIIACWGGNGYGSLDDGTLIDRLTPVDVLAR